MSIMGHLDAGDERLGDLLARLHVGLLAKQGQERRRAQLHGRPGRAPQEVYPLARQALADRHDRDVVLALRRGALLLVHHLPAQEPELLSSGEQSLAELAAVCPVPGKPQGTMQGDACRACCGP